MSEAAPLLIAVLLAFAVGGGVAWYWAAAITKRRIELGQKQARLRSAAELKKLRQELVLEREKHRRAEEVAGGVVRARDQEVVKFRAELVEAGKRLEEIRGLYLKAQGDVSRVRCEMAEQQVASDRTKKRLAELEWAVVPKRRKARTAGGEEVEIDVDSMVGDFPQPAPPPAASPARDPFDDTRPGFDFAAAPEGVGDDTRPAVRVEEEALAAAPAPADPPGPEPGEDTVFARPTGVTGLPPAAPVEAAAEPLVTSDVEAELPAIPFDLAPEADVEIPADASPIPTTIIAAASGPETAPDSVPLRESEASEPSLQPEGPVETGPDPETPVEPEPDPPPPGEPESEPEPPVEPGPDSVPPVETGPEPPPPGEPEADSPHPPTDSAVEVESASAPVPDPEPSSAADSPGRETVPGAGAVPEPRSGAEPQERPPAEPEPVLREPPRAAPERPSRAADEPSWPEDPAAPPIETIRGIGPAVAHDLRAAGLGTTASLANAAVDRIRAALPKRNRDKAEQFRNDARAALEGRGKSPGPRKSSSRRRRREG